MTCSPPPPSLYTVVSAESFGEEEDEEEEEEESDLEGTVPTPERRKLAREKHLQTLSDLGFTQCLWGLRVLRMMLTQVIAML